MKRHALVIGILLAAAATVAVAQDIETTMAGRAQIGVALLSEAWLQNPAGLGLMGPADGMAAGEGSWRHSVAGQYEVQGDVDLRTVSWGGQSPDGRYGIGAGWVDVAGMSELGIGFGMGTEDSRFAWGVNYQSLDIQGVGDLDIFDVGVGGRLNGLSATFDRATWGVVARDITEEGTRTFDAGMSFESPDWRLAFDVEDVTNEVGTALQVGAATWFGQSREWQAGAGLDDGNLTAGFVYHGQPADGGAAWKVGVAFIAGDDGMDDAWVLGAGADWGP